MEAGAETRVRLEAKAEVRDQYVGIFTDVLNKVNAEFNGLKREMVGAEEETKEKSERSRAEVESEEREAKEEEEAALQDMIQAKVEYWESHERAIIEEYAREKAEAETEVEAMMIENYEGIYRERDESKVKERAKDYMRKHVWRAKSLGH